MRLPRFHGERLPEEVGAAYVLEGDDAHHLGRVLRLGPGEEVVVFDGAGRAARFRVDEVGRRDARLTLIAPCPPGPALPFALTCAVAPPKGKRAQRLVEALTELGVTRLVPLVSAYSQGRPPASDLLRRWSLEAAKQCGRDALPEVAAPADVEQAAAAARDHELALLADTVDAAPLRDALVGDAPRSALVVVGPEGGLRDDERAALRAAGLRPVRLGPSVLRIETAAQAVIGALVARWA